MMGDEIQPHFYTPDYQAMGDCRICGHGPEKAWHAVMLMIATRAQHFDLAKGEPARFVRNGVLETCQCLECAARKAPEPKEPK